MRSTATPSTRSPLSPPLRWAGIPEGTASIALIADDPDARGLILFRFEGQYLPAVRKARNKDQLFRAWNAFHAYLTARQSRRKIFALSAQEADDFIERLVTLLELPFYTDQ
ncbi:MAG: hypothetical protein IIB14_06690 [Chloroflexi bacterium]|nr:hypothetical protein [Chloroflexota bacterium]